VPADAEIISALRRKAARGDSAAARELREWADRERATKRDPELWMRLLTTPQRDQLIKWIEEGEKAH
jgi:hypothetical protein